MYVYAQKADISAYGFCSNKYTVDEYFARSYIHLTLLSELSSLFGLNLLSVHWNFVL